MAKAKTKAGKGKIFLPHKGHHNHLCELVARRDMGTVAKLSKGAKCMCRICGRAATKQTNLCEPVGL